MSRRPGLPKDILAEVADRAIYGAGHDDNLPTDLEHGTVTALQACAEQPSPPMLMLVGQVFEHLNEHGAVALNVHSDIQELDQPGCLTISWSEGPSPIDVATTFAPYPDAGPLPKLPSWLALRSHTEFDLRWAQGWGCPIPVDGEHETVSEPA
ncbi:hypothetical protein [Tessaracoccus sp.]